MGRIFGIKIFEHIIVLLSLSLQDSLQAYFTSLSKELLNGE